MIRSLLLFCDGSLRENAEEHISVNVALLGTLLKIINMERTSQDAVADIDHADETLEKRFTRVLLTVFLCVSS